MYSKEFINLVNKAFCESEKLTHEQKAEGNPYYIGFGNPNAKILFVGKEKGFDKEKNLRQFEFESLLNPTEWKSYIDNSIGINTNKHYESNNYINAFYPYFGKNKAGHTWSKYEKILKNIYPDMTTENNNFFSYAFLTEVNFQPSKYSKIKAFKNQERIDFLKEEYFKSFDVILLACGKYLNNSQIEEIFNVKLLDRSKSEKHELLNVFKNENRILLNTRQLSMAVSNEYLKNISAVINGHLNII